MIQHYVPKVYLKNFAEERKKNFFAEVFDKTNGNRFKTNIKNICGELHLYTLNASRYKDPLIIEKIYAKIFEPLYAEVYPNLINDNLIRITPSQRQKILGAVFQLYFRNSKILIDAIEFHTSKIREIFFASRSQNIGAFKYYGKEYYILKDLDEQIQEFISDTKESFKLEHAKGFINLMRKNESQIICIYKVTDNSKFISSDNPLVSFNIDGSETNPFLRVSQFFLPLNEKYCLYLFNDKTKDKNTIYRENVMNGKTSLVNGYMLKNSIRFVIGDYNEIEAHNQLEEIMNEEYETNDEKFINLLKDLIRVLIAEKAPQDYIQVLEDAINTYNTNGHLSKEDRQIFYRNAIKKNREFGMRNL